MEGLCSGFQKPRTCQPSLLSWIQDISLRFGDHLNHVLVGIFPPPYMVVPGWCLCQLISFLSILSYKKNIRDYFFSKVGLYEQIYPQIYPERVKDEGLHFSQATDSVMV